MNNALGARVRAEFHCHTIYSGDSSNKPRELIARACQLGLGRLCVTDHNTIRGALAARTLDPQLIVVGEEIMTARGELLGYFLEEEIPPRLSPEETLRAFARRALYRRAAPFDTHRHAFNPRDLDWLAEEADAFEVFNARCFSARTNEKAALFTRQHSLAVIAGSDAHSLVELGLATLELPAFDNAEQLRTALKESAISARRLSVGEHLRASALIAAGRIAKAAADALTR